MKVMFTNHNYTKQKKRYPLELLGSPEKGTFATPLDRQ